MECTSGVVQGLTAFRKHYPGHRREEIDNCIQKADSFIQSIQRSDGSWFVPRTPFRREHVTHCFFLKKKNVCSKAEIVTTVILHCEKLSIHNNRYGSWAVCFTSGTWFGVKGLIAAGRTYENCPAIRKACNFLLSKELPCGGWGESHLSCKDKVHDHFFLLGNALMPTNGSPNPAVQSGDRSYVDN